MVYVTDSSKMMQRYGYVPSSTVMRADIKSEVAPPRVTQMEY